MVWPPAAMLAATPCPQFEARKDAANTFVAWVPAGQKGLPMTANCFYRQTVACLSVLAARKNDCEDKIDREPTSSLTSLARWMALGQLRSAG